MTDNTARSMSLDSMDDFSTQRDQPPFDPQFRPSPKSLPVLQANHGYHHGFPPIYRRLPSRHLHSVVTTSFSVDEERDDVPKGHARRRHHSHGHRAGKDERSRDGDEREGWEYVAPGTVYFSSATQSPTNNSMESRPFLQRSYSSSGYFAHSEAMKRSYYHHSYSQNNLLRHVPPEFMPPTKRSEAISNGSLLPIDGKKS